MAYKVFANGFPLQASELNENLMQQSIAVFTDASGRDAAITAPVHGQFAYLTGSDTLTKYDGSAWVDASATSPITTEGDLVVGDNTGSPSRLGIGTTDQILSSNGTTATWVDLPSSGASDWTVLASGSLTGNSVSITGLTPKNNYYVEVKQAAHDNGFGLCLVRFNGSSNAFDAITAKVQALSSYNPGIVFGASSTVPVLYRTGDQNGDGFGWLHVGAAQTAGTKLVEYGGAGSYGSGNTNEFLNGRATTNGIGAINSIQITTSTNPWRQGTYRVLGSD